MNLAQLKQRCEALGLKVTQRGRRPAKEDCYQVLRAYHLLKDYPSGPPYEELTPMLCFEFGKLTDKEQTPLWESPDWLVQRKLDGVRTILHLVKGVGVFAHSRELSQVAFRRHELSDHFVFRDFVPNFTATIDTEVVGPDLQRTVALLHQNAADSLRLQREYFPLTLYAFDIVRWGDTDLRPLRLRDRLEFLSKFAGATEVAELSRHFCFPEYLTKGKRAFFERTVNEGGEGVIFKNLNSTYRDSSSRSRHGWIKLKRSLNFTAFVSGFEPARATSPIEGKIACLRFSILTESGFQLIAKVSNLPRDFRKSVSHYDHRTKTVHLDPNTLGKVAEVEGLELAGRSARLAHPRILRWREDLQQTDCVYRGDDLKALRAGSTRVPMRVISQTAG